MARLQSVHCSPIVVPGAVRCPAHDEFDRRNYTPGRPTQQSPAPCCVEVVAEMQLPANSGTGEAAGYRAGAARGQAARALSWIGREWREAPREGKVR